jgi:hypothetical protein
MRNSFRIIAIVITLLCCLFSVCVAQIPPESVKVIEGLIQRLHTSTCDDQNACLVEAINTELCSNLIIFNEIARAERIVFHSDSCKAGFSVTLQIDTGMLARQWTIELRFRDSAAVSLKDIEHVLGKATVPQWSRQTKSSHYVFFDSLPTTIDADIRVSGTFNFLSSSGIPLVSAIKIRHQ